MEIVGRTCAPSPAIFVGDCLICAPAPGIFVGHRWSCGRSPVILVGYCQTRAPFLTIFVGKCRTFAPSPAITGRKLSDSCPLPNNLYWRFFVPAPSAPSQYLQENNMPMVFDADFTSKRMMAIVCDVTIYHDLAFYLPILLTHI